VSGIALLRPLEILGAMRTIAGWLETARRSC
jgi:hypothetical protein